MIVGIQGTNGFQDYNVFLRAMGVAMSGIKDEDTEFYLYSAGPAKVNSMVMEFANLSERGLKARGKKIKFFKVPPKWLEENISSFNYFVFLSKPNEPYSKLVSAAEFNNIEVGIYKY
jgi:hypothetical protein